MVLGKYFAALTMYVAGVLLSCINFIPLYVMGASESALEDGSVLTEIGPITGQIVGGVIAVILLGAALIAVGTLISALTENQLSAAVITVGVIAAMVLLSVLNMLTDSEGQPIIASYAVRYVIDWVSVLSRFTAFINGVFDYAALLYYASIAFVFLFLTVRVYEKRRWG
jgi:ABC-2 type transport system permease protein